MLFGLIEHSIRLNNMNDRPVERYLWNRLCDQPNDSSLTILKQILWQDFLKQANVLP